jgi:hypothetical protein
MATEINGGVRPRGSLLPIVVSVYIDHTVKE